MRSDFPCMAINVSVQYYNNGELLPDTPEYYTVGSMLPTLENPFESHQAFFVLADIVSAKRSDSFFLFGWMLSQGIKIRPYFSVNIK